MKKIFFYSSLLFAVTAMLMISCKKEKGLNIPVQHFISIGELREMYKGESLALTGKDKGGELFISGIVISNPAHGNNPGGRVFLQNYADGKLRGIALSVSEFANRYQAGDSVIAKVEGGVLERVDGILQVSGLTVLEVGRISVNNEQKVHLATDNFASILTNRDIYESTLVSLLSADVPDVVRGQTFGEGDVALSDGENTILVKTSATASFAAAEVPVSGDFTGIALYTGAQQSWLSIRGPEDYTGEYMAPENYTGFPEGWETIIGSRKTGVATDGHDQYLSGRWFLNRTISNSSVNIVHKNGTWAMMLGNNAVSSIAMDFDLAFGASKFSFYYGAATLNAGDSSPITVYAEYSQDSGATWLPVDPNEPGLLVSSQLTMYFKEYDNLNIEGNVRFRVRKDASTARLVVDDIFVKPQAAD